MTAKATSMSLALIAEYAKAIPLRKGAPVPADPEQSLFSAGDV